YRRKRRHVPEQLLAEKRVALDRFALMWRELARLYDDRWWQLRVADIPKESAETDGSDRDLVESEHLRDRDGARRNALAVAHHESVVRLERRRERDERIGVRTHVSYEPHFAHQLIGVA